MYSAMKVARYIIAHEKGCRRSVTNLRLQKLLYFVQAQFLVERNEPCFDAEIEAWDFGPVVPSVYREFKVFGANEIPRIDFYYDMNYNSDTFLDKIEVTTENFDNQERIIIEKVIDAFGRLSANELVRLTHAQDPWKNAYKKNKNETIENESIKEYFKA